jgi:hypothetical protein
MRIERWNLKLFALLMFLVAAAGCVAEGVEQEGAPVEPKSEELRARLCRSAADCPAPGAPCHLCSDGSSACPEVSCERHRCVYSFPECASDDPCAAVRCGAGTHCEAGSCIPDQERVFCGGIAGIPCPGQGRCVDDPSDSCDPNNGGADCGGLCTCVENVLCIKGSHFDSSPSVCACVPDAPPPPSCGGHSCGAGQYCCNPSCGICAPFGAACIQIACASPL